MKTQVQTIQKHTGMSPEQYDKVVFDTYLMCLSEVCSSPQHLQLLLTDSPINKWFLMELGMLNEHFIQQITPFEGLDRRHIRSHYRMCLKRIAQHYPSALISTVKVHNREKLTLCN